MKKETLKKISEFKQPYAFMEKFDIDLSLSENPLGCSPRVLKVIRSCTGMIMSYPDPNCSELKLALSDKFNLSREKIVIGNGSEQLIDAISSVLLSESSEAIIPETTFCLFEKSVILSGADPIFSKMSKDLSIDLDEIVKKITKKTKLIFICNPNNPTGKVIDREKLLEFVKKIQPINVVVDEANIDFGGDSVIRDVNNFDNLLVLRTFSKAFGLAGMRIGVCVCSKKIAQNLNRLRQPFAVNSLGMRCATVALKDKEFISKTKIFMEEERRFLSQELRSRGFEVVDSSSNNILVRVDRLFASSQYFTKLLNKKNVSVVDGSNFRGLGNKFVRVSPRTREINIKFLRVVGDLILARSE